jgi:MFS family permease
VHTPTTPLHADQTATAAEPLGGARAWFSVAILLVITVLSSVDRGVISLMVDPIKQDLQITDLQVSLLQGFAFALFYAMASVPMGWLGDRFSRHWVIMLGVTGWSLATAACGLAQSYWQLFTARLAVGIGEATLSPSSYAMVSELFPPRRLSMALGVLAAGVAVGSAAALMIGGSVVHWAEQVGAAGSLGGVFGGLRSWQLVFLLVGLPGVLLGPLVFLIPRRAKLVTSAQGSALAPAPHYGRWLLQALPYFAPLSLGFALHAVMAFGTAAWTPAYLSRHFHYDAQTIGMMLGLVQGIAGLIGFIGGGWLVDRMHARGVPDAHFRYFIVNSVVSSVIGVLAFSLVSSVSLLLGMVAVLNMLMPLTGPAIAHLQGSTPVQFRGRTVAIFMLIMNLLGMICGPSSVALFSEHVFGGPEHVGAGIALMFVVFGPLALLCFVLAIRPARRIRASGGAI